MSNKGVRIGGLFCKKCGLEKNGDRCAPCANAYQRAYRADPKRKQEMREHQRRYKQRHPERVAAGIRAYKLRTKYGLTQAEYEAMFAAQEGCCDICTRKLEQGAYGAYIDHCHTTGKVRAILCPPCNTLLGMAQDDIAVLERAIAYLKEHRDVV